MQAANAYKVLVVEDEGPDRARYRLAPGSPGAPGGGHGRDRRGSRGAGRRRRRGSDGHSHRRPARWHRRGAGGSGAPSRAGGVPDGARRPGHARASQGRRPFGYIVKPLGPASLHTSIEMAIYKHRMERQLEEQEAWYRTTLASVAEASRGRRPSRANPYSEPRRRGLQRMDRGERCRPAPGSRNPSGGGRIGQRFRRSGSPGDSVAVCPCPWITDCA